MDFLKQIPYRLIKWIAYRLKRTGSESRTAILIKFLSPFILLVVIFTSLSLSQTKTGLIVNNSQVEKKMLPRISFQQEEARIRQMFVAGGNSSTIAYFEHIYSDYDEATKHDLEHILGEELYKNKGLNGLALCPNSALFGCYHGFLSLALGKEGLNSLQKIKDICEHQDDFLRKIACIHGIGHGLLSLKGYPNFVLALKECDKLFSNHFLASMCHSGVFMEYRFESLQETSLTKQRLISSDPYKPCLITPEFYQSTCYLELAHWWSKILSRDYQQMIKLCGQVGNATNQEACFRGIGQAITVEVNYKPDQAGSRCRQIKDERGAYFCFSEVAKFILGRYGTPPSKVCQYLGSKKEELCIAEAKKFTCDNMSLCNEP